MYTCMHVCVCVCVCSGPEEVEVACLGMSMRVASKVFIRQI